MQFPVLETPNWQFWKLQTGCSREVSRGRLGCFFATVSDDRTNSRLLSRALVQLLRLLGQSLHSVWHDLPLRALGSIFYFIFKTLREPPEGFGGWGGWYPCGCIP